MDQVWKFFEVGKANWKEEIVGIGTAMRMGFNADKNEWARYIKSMLDDGRKKKKEKIVMDRGKMRAIRNFGIAAKSRGRK